MLVPVPIMNSKSKVQLSFLTNICNCTEVYLFSSKRFYPLVNKYTLYIITDVGIFECKFLEEICNLVTFQINKI